MHSFVATPILVLLGQAPIPDTELSPAPTEYRGHPLLLHGPSNTLLYKAADGTLCGHERWDVKTGQDADAGSINLNAIKKSTVPPLRALPRPATLSPAKRANDVEKTVYQLSNVTLKQFRRESTDSDYHLVLQSGSNANTTMIVEIPAPSCVDGGPFLDAIKKARATLDAKFPGSEGNFNWTKPGTKVTVRGVGFFDFSHQQTGAAPNQIELHPVTAICFGPNCKIQ